MQVSVSRGAIGTSADVDANDHAAPTNASASPCIFGSSAADGDWVRIELPAALLSYIGNDSITQIRISAPASSGLLSLSGTTDPDFAPILDLKYGPALTTGLASVDIQSGLGVYPNPTSGEVVITGNTSELQGIRILDMSGRTLAEWRGNATRYSLEAYPAGMYILQLDTDAGMQTRRIVKR